MSSGFTLLEEEGETVAEDDSSEEADDSNAEVATDDDPPHPVTAEQKAIQQEGSELLEAIERGEVEVALRMLEHGRSEVVNYTDDSGRNALLLAATENRLEVCRVLLAREDFDGVNACTLNGATALHLAAGNDCLRMCQELLNSPRFVLGVNALTRRGQTPLDFCREFGTGAAEGLLVAAGGASARRRSRLTVPGELRRGSASAG